jgi:hypothetical protein
VIELRATVYMSWGYWVAECPYPDCGTGQHYGADPNTGHVGGLTREAFSCPHCGTLCPVDWPPNAADIWRLLSQRPLKKTRSWMPGEDIANLLAENVAHGLIDAADVPAGLVALDGYLSDAARAVAGSTRFAIGAGH